MTIPNPDPGNGFIQPQHRPTNRQYSAIGRVAAMWSELEHLLEITLSRLALVPSLLGYVLTDKLGPDNRLGAIKSLITIHRRTYDCRIIDAETLTALDALLRSIEKLKGDRNYVAHTVWSKASDEQMIPHNFAAVVRSGAIYGAGEGERVSDIEELGTTIQVAAGRLWQLASRIALVDGPLLGRLQTQEQRNRRKPYAQLEHQSQRQSYTRLQPDFGPQPQQAPKKKAQAPTRATKGKK